MLEFAAALFLILVTPGPGVLSLAAVGSAFGAREGLVYGTGLFVGSNMVMAAAAAGLAVLLEANPALRYAFVAASSAYLLWLAWKVASAGGAVGFGEAKEAPGFGGAILLQVANPKAYAVGTFVFSFPIGLAGATEIATKFAVLNAIWVPIHLLWLWAGVAIRRLELPSHAQRRINVGMALALVAVVAIAAWSTLAAG